MRTRIAIWLLSALAVAPPAPTARAQPESKTASELVARGKTAFQKGEYENAIKDYTAAIKLDPRAAAAYTGRGLALTKRGDPLTALGDFNEALALDPNDARAYAGRGLARVRAGSTEKAVADLNRAVALDPKLAMAFHGRGLARQDAGELLQAIADYTEAVRLDPESADALVDRGDAYLATRALDKAIADCTEAVRLEPKLARAFYTRGIGWFRKGVIDKALADSGEAIRLDPKVQKYYLFRSECLLQQGTDLAAALKDANEAIRIDPKDPWAFGQRADVRRTQGEWAEARKDFDAAVRLGPNAAELYRVRAVFLACCPEAASRDEAQAFKDANRACELTDWKNPYALEALATASAALGDFPGAVKWQKKALENREYATDADYAPARVAAYEARRFYRFAPPIRDRSDAREFVTRGTHFFQTREYENALRDFDEAIRLDPKSAKAYYGRGCVWARGEQNAKALADLSQAVKLDPKDVSAYVDRGLVRMILGEWELALADWDVALKLDPKQVSALTYRATVRAGSADPTFRDAAKALKDAREACELTNWKAGGPLASYAAACAEGGYFDDAVRWQTLANADEEYMKRFGPRARAQLQSFQAKKPLRLSGPSRKPD